MTMVLNAVVRSLKNMGVSIKSVCESTSELGDHAIWLSDKVHIQIASYGDSYMMVVREDSDGQLVFYPERLDFQMLGFDIRKALLEEDR